VGVPEFLDQLLIGSGLLQDVQVLTMEVLDQRLFEAVDFVRLLHEHGDGLQPGPSSRTPPSLTGDQLVLVGGTLDLSDEDRLEHPELLDRRRQRRHGLLVEVHPGLQRVGPDVADRDLPENRRPLPGDLRGNQSTEPLTQSATT
jgi:hypothetical protein